MAIYVEEFSEEQREFDFGRNAGGGIKNMLRNAVTKVTDRAFLAGVIYIKKVCDLRSHKITFQLEVKKSKKSKDLREANESAKEIYNNMKENLQNKGEKPTDGSSNMVQEFPVKILRGRDFERFDADAQKEIEKIASDDRWTEAQIKVRIFQAGL